MRVTGTLLPSGERTELWLLGDRVTFTRPHTETRTVGENLFLTPGLVDVHTHPGHDEAAVFTGEQFAAECAQHVAAGTTALRVPGHTGPVPPELRTDPAMPRLVTAGRLLAHPGLATGHPMHTPTDDLVAAGLAEAAANDGWCKIVADWERDRPRLPGPAGPGRGRPGRPGRLRRRPAPGTRRPEPSPPDRPARLHRPLMIMSCGHRPPRDRFVGLPAQRPSTGRAPVAGHRRGHDPARRHRDRVPRVAGERPLATSADGAYARRREASAVAPSQA